MGRPMTYCPSVSASAKVQVVGGAGGRYECASSRSRSESSAQSQTKLV